MNKRLFGLQDISKARNFIYGVTIIWIVFYHCGLRPSTTFFNTIKSYGDCGVEIFFLLSGICLFYSYNKNNDTLAFYKRRAVKIFPPYLIVYGIMFIWLDIISTFNIRQFILDYTLLDFWLHGLGRAPWFVASIIVFYCLYPLIYKILFGDSKKKPLNIAIFITVAILVIIALVKFFPHLNIFSARIPIFILGCAIGKLVYNDYDIKLWHILVLLLLLIFAFVAFRLQADIWWLRNVFYAMFSIAITLILGQIYKLLNRFAPILNKPFLFLGNLTFEIYLCHEKIQENVIALLRWWGISVDFFDIWYQWLCIALTVVIAFAVHSVALSLFKVKKKKSQQ